MDRTTVVNTIRQFISKLREKIDVKEAIVFGSHVWGKPHKDSDIDVIIVSEDFKRLTSDERWYFLHDYTIQFDTIIEAWGFTEQEVLERSHTSVMSNIYHQGWHIT